MLGVSQDRERFEVSGVDEPDKVQNDFLSVLHAGQKISHDVDVSEHRAQAAGEGAASNSKAHQAAEHGARTTPSRGLGAGGRITVHRLAWLARRRSGK